MEIKISGLRIKENREDFWATVRSRDGIDWSLGTFYKSEESFKTPYSDKNDVKLWVLKTVGVGRDYVSRDGITFRMEKTGENEYEIKSGIPKEEKDALRRMINGFRPSLTGLPGEVQKNIDYR